MKTRKSASTVKRTTDKELLQLAKRIKELREKKGFKSYEHFAYEHEIHRTQMGRYEAGTDIRFKNLLRVIRALGVTPQEFFSEGFNE